MSDFIDRNEVFLPRLALNGNPSNLCLPRSWDYRCELPGPAISEILMTSKLFCLARHDGACLDPSIPEAHAGEYEVQNKILSQKKLCLGVLLLFE
jgi:hypothetical protein